LAEEWILPGRHGVDALIDAADAICDAWPEAVVEDTAAHEFAYSVDALLPTTKSELCVYRNLDAARRWQQGAPRRELHNSMIQISLTPLGLRLIADDWNDVQLTPIARRLFR
jgi:hypothetical protein